LKGKEKHTLDERDRESAILEKFMLLEKNDLLVDRDNLKKEKNTKGKYLKLWIWLESGRNWCSGPFLSSRTKWGNINLCFNWIRMV